MNKYLTSSHLLTGSVSFFLSDKNLSVLILSEVAAAAAKSL